MSSLNGNLTPIEEEEIIDDLKMIKVFEKAIPKTTSFYLENFCRNINSKEKFCSLYTAQDTWSKIINKELPKYKISYKCKQILNLESLKDEDLSKCAKLLSSSPLVCANKGALGKTVLFPYPKCNEISKSLKKGNLYYKVS